MKITDLIERCREEKNLPFFSLEFFPPKTEEALYNLQQRVERLVKDLGPLFVDLTWGAGGTTFKESLELSSWIQKYSGTDVMMHLTLTNISIESIDSALSKAKESGIRNILALRGDPPRGQDKWSNSVENFEYAADLVRHIRKNYGDYFGICVAGYPEGHNESTDLETDIGHLKSKVDAGADLVITQLFYDVDLFLKYLSKCRDLGIKCPIIPGIMPIQSYQGFNRMISMCKVSVPSFILEKLEEIKDDEDQVKAFGVEVAVEMCRKLIANGVEGLHFYTLNLERSVTKIISQLSVANLGREVPWLRSANRAEEWIRPINWSKRPKSYIERTTNWDDYPNGRWSDSRSPAYGFSYNGVQVSYTPKQKQNLVSIWGVPQNYNDIKQVFLNFLNGNISKLPWFEDQGLQNETLMIKNFLVSMNEHGLLTINSQPRVNCASASDPKVGWGPRNLKKGGYVYQREYVEFFCSEESINTIIQTLNKYSTVSYIAVNKQNNFISNVSEGNVIAMTWGVFPNRELMQTTILDPYIFKTWWKEEAFGVWINEWGRLYERDSLSYTLLENIMNTYYLVNVLENDYVEGNLEKVFNEAFEALSSN